MSERKESQAKAKRIMSAVAGVCIAIGLSLGAQQVGAHGLHSFLKRQPGIGASPGDINCPKIDMPTAPIPCPVQHRDRLQKEAH